MASFIARRFLYMLVLVLLGSVVAFIVITLPPGDYISSYVAQLQSQGTIVGEDVIQSLRQSYGLNQPLYVQYAKWMWKLVHGDLGYSFQFNRPVAELIQERIGMTLLVSVGALLLTYGIAIPIGIYSAVHQYSPSDYAFTAISFFGVSMPNFLLALILLVLLNRNFGIDAGGLFSSQFRDAPWGWGKLVDLLKHLPLPVIAIGLSGTASITRVTRAMLLDELNKPYVATARAKGLTETKLLLKYPVRVALNPVVSTIGWALPSIFSGATIVSIVLNLPTVGPLLYQALMTEDMFLAGSIVIITIGLTAVGMLFSDILLAWLDPRIHFA
jgi:peptide/nickel transport system permease protein